MTKDMFTFLMGVTTIIALIAMGLLFSDVGALIYPISLALFAAVQAPFFIRLKKEQDERDDHKAPIELVRAVSAVHKARKPLSHAHKPLFHVGGPFFYRGCFFYYTSKI